MALSTDFKDDVLASSNSKRKYNMIHNPDGTVSFEDVTVYSQEGSDFSAKEVNEEREEINKHTTLLGDTDISSIEDGTVTGALAGLNGKFVYEGRVVKINNSNLYYVSKPGYSLIHASNGNWDGANVLIKGIARQGITDIIFFEGVHNGNFQLTLLWARND